jgi:hypothetical protein
MSFSPRFKDVDSMGHVNNANHLTYAEEARIDYLNKIFGLKMSWKKHSNPNRKNRDQKLHPDIPDKRKPEQKAYCPW